ncbi:MAG TPA: RlmE family RNA methyltransferase [Candidatus Thermoplasmatota archaeon]|nr:RlmE family RNA methyltransferase [Candidatus Thermoplasmatota archaeon]
MSRKWLRERSKDAWYKKAKKEGYRSRASYKLLQIDERFELFEPGMRVVDLGAAPGGWSQVAAILVGSGGSVIGVDLDPITPLTEDEVGDDAAPATFLRGDITRSDTVARTLEAAGGAADVVISDMSPNISGQYSVDQARSAHLAGKALAFAERVLVPGGAFICKVFEGEDLKPFLDEVRARFREVKVTSPAASRSSSSEVYVVARDFVAMKMPPLTEAWKEGTPVADAPIRKRKRAEKAERDGSEDPR